MADDGPEWLAPIAELRAVIPVVRETPLREKGRLTGRLIVSSIELWAAGVVVHYVVSAHDFTAREHGFDIALTLADDIGTDYHRVAGGGGGGSNDLLLWMNVE